MSDTPDPNKPQSESSQDSAPESTPQEPQAASPVKAPSKPVKPPSKPTPKPISITPTEKKEAPASKPDTSITFDEGPADDTPSTAMLVVDGLAAVIAITFTVLIVRDAMPFL
ncbi:hypothetical protein DDZ13_06935 [Coraliomargarita sinensis]|uniref:Uncharacterized protein n=1 Tax=Coraliomargarita sinensis TaxID=2174842 RepID=A0A317ZFK5_9BACT|nr:hypothetical protein [Coraliomargarita sinensis]PXA04266.1 hypothetical protein DDZ13_06935 [Coraliomargarita sinensis]